ncbi:MAG: protein phosphatase CheZ [Gammaproteobacteria bacterium]|jgi:chemotaxis protein CheZ|nr:protein phosphatase CheZ [Gammaproteobacteria bacterium]
MSKETASQAIDASRYDAELAELVAAWNARDERRFVAQLDALAATHDHMLLKNVGELTRGIETALERFCVDARVEDLSRKEVPDARVSLEHVLKLTDEAAHRTMDLVEQSHVPAESILQGVNHVLPNWQQWREGELSEEQRVALLGEMSGFLAAAHENAERIRANLSEVLLAQGYQDLSGQIIRSVMNLIDEIQEALAGMVALSRGQEVIYRAREPVPNGACGPQVPGVAKGQAVGGQDEVDLLLSGLNL